MDQNMAMLVVQDVSAPAARENKDAQNAPEDPIERAKLAALKMENTARARAEQIVQDANQKAQQLVQEAWQQGYAAGREEGILKGKQSVYRTKQQEGGFLKTVITRLEEFEQGLFKEAESAVLKLSVNIAEKIVNKHVECNDTFIVENIRAALKGFDEDRKVVVRISAEDYELYMTMEGEPLEQVFSREWLTVVRDEFMKRGDCIIECENSIVDVGMDSQLSVIRRSLLGERNGEGSR